MKTGIIVGILIGLLVSMLVGMQIHEHNNKPAVIENRASAAYTRWAESNDWYIGDKHLPTWAHLTDAERDAWRLPLIMDF